MELEKVIKEKIQKEYMNLMTDEQWAELVKKEVEEFISPTPNRGYNSNTGPSRLTQLVYQELTEKFKQLIKELLDDPKFIPCFDISGQPMASEALKDIIRELAPEIWISAVSNGSQNIINAIRSQI